MREAMRILPRHSGDIVAFLGWAGGYGLWALGVPEPDHDVNFLVGRGGCRRDCDGPVEGGPAPDGRRRTGC